MPTAVIIGAGVFGSSVARQLAIEGWEVTLVEQESPGWDGSSSGGESRLLRFSHGSDRWYTRSAWRARELWRKIDPTLVADCGLAWFAYGDDGWKRTRSACFWRSGFRSSDSSRRRRRGCSRRSGLTTSHGFCSSPKRA